MMCLTICEHASITMALESLIANPENLSSIHDQVEAVPDAQATAPLEPEDTPATFYELMRYISEAQAEAEWRISANCRGVDPDLFFPERGESTREAKEVCRGCVVREDCLDYVLRTGEKFGIWGGLSQRELNRVRRQRSLGAVSLT